MKQMKMKIAIALMFSMAMGFAATASAVRVSPAACVAGCMDLLGPGHENYCIAMCY